MNLRGGLLSRLGYLGSARGDNGVPVGLAPSKASPNDDSGVTSVVSCSSTSPASGTSPVSDILTSGSEGLHAPLFTSVRNLASFVRNYHLPRALESLKTGYSEHSSNGPHEQIVFDPHSELGKCADLSSDWSVQESTFQLYASNYEPRPLHSNWNLGVSASTVAPPWLC